MKKRINAERVKTKKITTTIEMRYLSLFSGIEAVSVAWESLGFECVGVAEILKYQSSVLHKHYPNIKNFGDVTKITEDDIKGLGKIDIVIFGSPCQDLSVAGKQQGLHTVKDDTNHSSILFYEGVRVFKLAQKHCGARYMVWENVPGALNSNKGEDFATILRTLVGTEFGANRPVWGNEGVCFGRDSMCEWAVLDAQWFGVAQRRRRLFIVLDTGDWSSRKPILLESDSMRGNPKTGREKEKGSSSKIEGCLGNSIFNEVEKTCYDMQAIGEYGDKNVASTLKARDYKDVTDIVVETYSLAGNIIGRSPEHGGNGTGYDVELMYTLTATDHHAVAKCFQQNIRSEVRYINGDGDIAGALSASSGANQTNYLHLPQHTSIRRLTPLECERLQGFPDNYTKIDGAAFSKRINALGRSMAVPVIKWIGERIKNA